MTATDMAGGERLLISLDEDSEDDPVLDLAALFGNDHPIEIELGIGKGRFLLDAAARHPEVNYLGVEQAVKYLRLAYDRAHRRELANLRFVHGDAREFIEFFLAAGSVRALHVYFPDPWPKKRHHKRRLLNAHFLNEAGRVLESGGRVWIATDHDDYYEHVLEVLVPFRDRFEVVEAAWEGARTNYEEKFIRRGQSIHRRVLQKV